MILGFSKKMGDIMPITSLFF